MLEERIHRLERELEDRSDDPEALYLQLIRITGVCLENYSHPDNYAIYVCVRHKNHSGPHASDWVSTIWPGNEDISPCSRLVWNTLILSNGEKKAVAPSSRKYKMDPSTVGRQRANWGNIDVYPPYVPKALPAEIHRQVDEIYELRQREEEEELQEDRESDWLGG